MDGRHAFEVVFMPCVFLHYKCMSICSCKILFSTISEKKGFLTYKCNKYKITLELILYAYKMRIEKMS